ncbi:hypothetical protein [Actinokineospora enzanensis]|uniref:hypothetical protein n=1 Tax=Actinokineospora enzanensis TaxID=155975 RepID=UPI00037A80CF|nr:hypothetical protein [Actinokineospora enzanensis]
MRLPDLDPALLFTDDTLGRQFETDLLRALAEPDSSLGPGLTDLVYRGTTIPTPTDAAAWRRRTGKLGRAVVADPQPMELRTLVTVLYVELLAHGVWERDESWRAELAALVTVLLPTDDEYAALPGPVTEFAVALGALCVALLRQDTKPDGVAERDHVAADVWRDTRDRIALADPALVDRFHTAHHPQASTVGDGELRALIDLALTAEDDPDALLREKFTDAEIPAERHDGAWVVDGEFRNPRRFAARAATIAGAPCVVIARNAKKSTVILVADSRIAIAESTVPRWRVYHLGPASTPLTLFGGDEAMPPTRETHPLVPMPQIVRDLAEAAGVNPVLLIAALR